jgi:hypothetical protein
MRGSITTNHHGGNALRESISGGSPDGESGRRGGGLRDSIFGRSTTVAEEPEPAEPPTPSLFDCVHDLVDLSEDLVQRLEMLYATDATLAERLLPQICTVYLYGAFAEKNRLPLRDQIFQFLQDKSDESVRFAMQLHWALGALSHVDMPPDAAARLQAASQRLAHAHLPSGSTSFSPFQAQRDFCQKLCRKSSELRDVDKPERNQELAEFIDAINPVLEEVGVFLPSLCNPHRVTRVVQTEQWARAGNPGRASWVMATGGGSRTPLWLTLEVEDRPNWLWQAASAADGSEARMGATPFSVIGEEWAGTSSPSPRLREPEPEPEPEPPPQAADAATFEVERGQEAGQHDDGVQRVSNPVANGSLVSPMRGDVGGATASPMRGDNGSADEQQKTPTRSSRSLAAAFDTSFDSQVTRYKRAMYEQQTTRIERTSLIAVMVKTEDDLRAEQFAAQMLHAFNQVFKDAGLNDDPEGLELRPYEVIATGASEGFVEILSDTQTLAGLIQRLEREDPPLTLVEHFNEASDPYRDRFVSSLAAYSLFCYFLQIKDRHNENIMMDRRGQLIHIDFGYMFQSSPGGGSAFGGWEASSFKLSDDFIFIAAGPDVETRGMRCAAFRGGNASSDDRQRAVNSEGFQRFRQLFAAGFEALHNNSRALTELVELAGLGNPHWKCWGGDWRHAADMFRERLELDVGTFRRTRMNYCCKAGLLTCCNPSSEAKIIAEHLIDSAIDNFGAKCYDRCQKWQNDIQY